MVEQSEAVVAIGRANVENAELLLSYTRITSPIRGRVGLRLIDQGNIVKANDAGGLAMITQLNPIAVVFTIPQDDIPLLQSSMKQSGDLAVEAFDRDVTSKLALGKLSAIDNQVDPTTGTLKLKATFENGDQTLFPNQFVNARLRIDTIRNAVVVPSLAIQRGPDFRYVYVVRSDETVELRKIEVGPTDGSDSSITAGLLAGETVVTTGIDKLQPNSKVVLPKRKTDSAG
jgi:multidrug efflux system membrane fusion protein